jgi:hypothetical protein
MTGPGNRRANGSFRPVVFTRRRCGGFHRGGTHILGEIALMGSVIKKRRKRMAKKKHRKLLRKTRVARRKAGK